LEKSWGIRVGFTRKREGHDINYGVRWVRDLNRGSGNQTHSWGNEITMANALLKKGKKDTWKTYSRQKL